MILSGEPVTARAAFAMGLVLEKRVPRGKGR
jgi:hypothetical protein